LPKILVIRFSSIGDIVLTTPVLRCLKAQIPGVEIHYLTKEKYYPILQANPNISGIHTFKEDMNTLKRSLKKQDFDFVVDLHKNIRSARVKLALGKPSASFNKLNVYKWLMVNFKVNKLPDIHIVDRYFHALRKLRVENDNKGLDYYIPEDEDLSAKDLPAEYQNGFIAFAIGGMHYTKMLPEEKIIALCQTINRPVVLLGGPEDKAKADRVVNACGNEVFNGCGQFTINQSAAIIRMASKVLTNDTGLMHIAAAFRKEIISFWGNTIPGFGMYPYLPAGEGASHIFEIDGLACRPCSKIGHDHCPKKHFKCMMDIQMEDVLKKLST